jgi:hypothetical protein
MISRINIQKIAISSLAPSVAILAVGGLTKLRKIFGGLDLEYGRWIAIAIAVLRLTIQAVSTVPDFFAMQPPLRCPHRPHLSAIGAIAPYCTAEA